MPTSSREMLLVFPKDQQQSQRVDDPRVAQQNLMQRLPQVVLGFFRTLFSIRSDHGFQQWPKRHDRSSGANSGSTGFESARGDSKHRGDEVWGRMESPGVYHHWTHWYPTLYFFPTFQEIYWAHVLKTAETSKKAGYKNIQRGKSLLRWVICQ